MNIVLFMLGFALKANTQRRFDTCNAALTTAKFISSFDPASTIITRVKGKAVISAPSKMNPGVKCFHYHGLGHVQSQCPKWALLIEQDDLEEVWGPMMFNLIPHKIMMMVLNLMMKMNNF